jgi:hypothetical protein
VRAASKTIHGGPSPRHLNEPRTPEQSTVDAHVIECARRIVQDAYTQGGMKAVSILLAQWVTEIADRENRT